MNRRHQPGPARTVVVESAADQAARALRMIACLRRDLRTERMAVEAWREKGGEQLREAEWRYSEARNQLRYWRKVFLGVIADARTELRARLRGCAERRTA